MSMHPALGIGQSGLNAQATRVANIAQNLANVGTTAYKTGTPKFLDLSYQTVRQPGAQVGGDAYLPSGLMLGTGVQLSSIEKDFSMGERKQTDRPLDLMIDGKNGFFQIERADGTIAYTRDGSFNLDAQGNIVTSEGLKLSPTITIPNNAEKIMISPEGVVSVIVPGSTAAQAQGSIQIATFINQAGLEPIGNNLYLQTDSSGAPTLTDPGTDSGHLVQNALESSNVNIVKELVDMIEAQRAYETNAKLIENVDHSLQAIIQAVR